MVQLDKPITPSEMEQEWLIFQTKIAQSLQNTLHNPVQQFYSNKGKEYISANEYNTLVEELTSLEFEIVAWMELKKRNLLYANNLDKNGGYKQYIRSAFLEDLDEIENSFDNVWLIPVQNRVESVLGC